MKAPKKASKEGIRAKDLPSLKRAPINSFKSPKIDTLASVKNYLLKDHFEVVHKKENPTTEANIILLLDTSGSMAAEQQISYVKGMVEKTISQQRHKSIRFALVVLGGEDARILQAFTKNHQQLSNFTYSLRTRGKTNLGAAFMRVHELCRSLDKSTVQLFTFTDGKANVAGNHQTPFDFAVQCYRKYVGSRIQTSIIDTEIGFLKLGKAKKLAEVLGVDYRQIHT